MLLRLLFSLCGLRTLYKFKYLSNLAKLRHSQHVFFRANTNELGNFPKGMKRTDLVVVPGDTLQQEIVSYGQTPKHAHFSSAESIENGNKNLQSLLSKRKYICHIYQFEKAAGKNAKSKNHAT